MIKEAPPSATRIERVLAYMLASVIGLSILSFFAIIFGTLFGMTGPDFARGAWPAAAILPYYGLPSGVALIITLVIVSARRRARESRAAAATTAASATKRPATRGVAAAKAASSAARSATGPSSKTPPQSPRAT